MDNNNNNILHLYEAHFYISNKCLLCKIKTLDKDLDVSRFLNRMLGMPVGLQNHLFQCFTSALTAIVLEAKKSGCYDFGILDLGSGQFDVKRKKVISFDTP